MDDIGKESHQYRPVDQNSNTVVGTALERVGLPRPKNDGFSGNWAPGADNTLPDDYWFDDGHQCVSTWQNDIPRSNQYHIYDPLVLDLDGNGIIDIQAINGYKGAMFDHDGDGIATATSWIGGKDGLLVFDKNNDGIINSGRELFGDSIKKANNSIFVSNLISRKI